MGCSWPVSPDALRYLSASLIATVFHLRNIFKVGRVAFWPYECLHFLKLASAELLVMPSYHYQAVPAPANAPEPLNWISGTQHGKVSLVCHSRRVLRARCACCSLLQKTSEVMNKHRSGIRGVLCVLRHSTCGCVNTWLGGWVLSAWSQGKGEWNRSV